MQAFDDKTMNRAQLRAARSVLRKLNRSKDTASMMPVFAAARAKGWIGPEARKATTYVNPVRQARKALPVARKPKRLNKWRRQARRALARA